MTFKDHFITMARYNLWANALVYDACAPIDDAQRRTDMGAYFKSIHGTLNHILIGDRIWFSRFRGTPWTDYNLHGELYADFEDLRAAHKAEGEALLAWLQQVEDAALAGAFSYTTAAGGSYTTPYGLGLTHAFNHATHHRGQVHVLIGQAGHPTPDLDLIFYLREVGL